MQLSGLVVATRLSEDPNTSVLVLEAGESNLDDPELCQSFVFILVVDCSDRRQYLHFAYFSTSRTTGMTGSIRRYELPLAVRPVLECT